MPVVGIGLHVLIAIFFAVHALRTGQPLYWLIILFSFPLLGSVVYFVAVYLPNSRLETGARRAVRAAARSLDPTRELREARAAFEFTPTAQNQMRLAAALLEAGEAKEAARNYEACLQGPFAADPDIQFLAARAFLESGHADAAIPHLEKVRAKDAAFRPEAVGLLLARAYAAAGRPADARAQFEATLGRFASFESRVEYAIWALGSGEPSTAARLQAEIEQIVARWSRHTRDLNQPLLRRWQAAREAASRAA
jgi:hypothetical protein